MNKHHTINYIELPSTDLTATKDFYSTLFGWSFTDWGPTYSSFDGAGVSGGFDSTGEAKPTKEGTKVILYSQVLEKSRDAIKEYGGEITKDIYSFPGGRRFYFLDPSGNELALWSE